MQQSPAINKQYFNGMSAERSRGRERILSPPGSGKPEKGLGVQLQGDRGSGKARPLVDLGGKAAGQALESELAASLELEMAPRTKAKKRLNASSQMMSKAFG
jgi:hypothetical protein